MKTIELYTLKELKKKFTDGYSDAIMSWRSYVKDQSISICDKQLREIKESIDIVRGHCGEPLPFKDLKWYKDDVLTPLGYTVSEDGIDGTCKLTGKYTDDVFIGHIFRELKNGKTLEKALSDFPLLAVELFNDEVNDAMDESSMLVHWENALFTRDGFRAILPLD